MKKKDKGVYLLVLNLSEWQKISAGILPDTEFQPGIYLYIGRAKRNLQARIQRHLKNEKKLFWHIDYFLQKAEIREIWVKSGAFGECQILRQIKNLREDASFPAQKFGSSDCRCCSHLIYLPEGANLDPLRKKLSFKKVGIHGNEA